MGVPVGSTWVWLDQLQSGHMGGLYKHQLHQHLSPKAEARKPSFRSAADAVMRAAGPWVALNSSTSLITQIR